MAIQRDSKGAFVKGHCPNAGGRSKTELEFLRGISRHNPAARQIIIQALVAKLNEKVKDEAKGRTFAECIAESLIRKAIMGDVSAAREIADRVEGRLPSTVSGGDHSPDDQTEPDIYTKLAQLVNSVKRNKQSLQ